MDIPIQRKKMDASKIIIGLVVAILAFLIISYIGYYVWNMSMPKMFDGVSKIGWVTMMAFLILIFIVGSFWPRYKIEAK
jgi:uncharacterized membrane protein